jgi:hypothetical protein
MHDIILADSEGALAKQLCSGHQVGVGVFDPLGVAGRARGVEPEGNFIGDRVGSKRRRVGIGDQILERMGCLTVAPAPTVRPVADDNDVFQPRQPIDDRRNRLCERFCHNQHRRAAIAEYVGVLRERQVCIERDRDRAGADCTPERHRVVDGVVEQERCALFVLHTQAAQGVGEANAARLQLAIGERAVRVNECDLVAEPARHIGVNEIADCVVGAALGEIVLHAPPDPVSLRRAARRVVAPARRRPAADSGRG